MIWLLDASVLIALTDSEHTAHERCRAWMPRHVSDDFATCPFTQTALVRYTLRRRPDLGMAGVLAALDQVCRNERHRFWPEDLPVVDVDWSGVIGHRQVTDGYLAALARARSGSLITLDVGLAATHPDVAMLVDESGER